MHGIRGKAGVAPREGLWERRDGRREAKGEEEGSGVTEQQGLVFQEKPFCLWQRFCREIPEQLKIILHVLCKPANVG